MQWTALSDRYWSQNIKYPPILMKRKTAAAYCDMAEAAFMRSVTIGDLPQPISIGNKDYWHRSAIEGAVTLLENGGTAGLKRGIGGTWREDSSLYKDDPGGKYRD